MGGQWEARESFKHASKPLQGAYKLPTTEVVQSFGDGGADLVCYCWTLFRSLQTSCKFGSVRSNPIASNTSTLGVGIRVEGRLVMRWIVGRRRVMTVGA